LEGKEMPVYEYRCHKCGQTLEMMQKFSDAPLSRCPQCNGRVSKIISNCAFHLKGSGWYVTDYKKNDSTWKDKTPETKTTENQKTESSPKVEDKKD
jgi:putative FmdB family regulatory protein